MKTREQIKADIDYLLDQRNEATSADEISRIDLQLWTLGDVLYGGKRNGLQSKNA